MPTQLVCVCGEMLLISFSKGYAIMQLENLQVITMLEKLSTVDNCDHHKVTNKYTYTNNYWHKSILLCQYSKDNQVATESTHS